MRRADAKSFSKCLAVCLAVVFLNGCISGQPSMLTRGSTTAAIDVSPSPIATSFQSTSVPKSILTTAQPELIPVASISREIFDTLGTGIRGDILLTKTGLDFNYLVPGMLCFRITEDPDSMIELKMIKQLGAVVVHTAIRIDTSGRTLLFEPVPDKVAIDDFQIITGSQQILDFDGLHTEDELNHIFGKNLRRQMAVMRQSDGLGAIRTLTISYQDIELALNQLEKTTQSNQWSISKIICQGSAFTNPRGLRIGMNYQEIIRLLGTGDFNLLPDDLPEPTSLEIRKQDPANDCDYLSIILNLDNGQVTSLTMIFEGP